MYVWKLSVNKQETSLPIVVDDIEAVTADGINMADDRYAQMSFDEEFPPEVMTKLAHNTARRRR